MYIFLSCLMLACVHHGETPAERTTTGYTPATQTDNPGMFGSPTAIYAGTVRGVKVVFEHKDYT